MTEKPRPRPERAIEVMKALRGRVMTAAQLAEWLEWEPTKVSEWLREFEESGLAVCTSTNAMPGRKGRPTKAFTLSPEWIGPRPASNPNANERHA